MTTTTPVTVANSLSGLTTPATTQVGSDANDSTMNEFLQLLVAQLQNQDPTNPTDPTQFVAQLAQFSTVEQLTQSNSTLDTMSNNLSSLDLGQYAGMINQTVASNASQVTVPASGSVSASLNYSLTSSSLSNVNLQVTNSSGTVVNQIAVSGSNGTITFNGVDSSGNALPAGQYTLSLVGTGSGNQSQSAGSLAMSGQVIGVVQASTNTWLLQLSNGLEVSPTTLTSMD